MNEGVQAKLWDPLSMCAISEHLRGMSQQGVIQIHVYLYLYYSKTPALKSSALDASKRSETTGEGGETTSKGKWCTTWQQNEKKSNRNLSMQLGHLCSISDNRSLKTDGLKTRKTMMSALTSQLRSWAICNDSSCSGMTVRMPWRQSTCSGTSIVLYACALVSVSPTLQITIGFP